jgi:hypothetical protein
MGKSRERVPNWVIALDVAVINLSMLLAYLLRYRLKWLMDGFL